MPPRHPVHSVRPPLLPALPHPPSLRSSRPSVQGSRPSPQRPPYPSRRYRDYGDDRGGCGCGGVGAACGGGDGGGSGRGASRLTWTWIWTSFSYCPLPRAPWALALAVAVAVAPCWPFLSFLPSFLPSGTDFPAPRACSKYSTPMFDLLCKAMYVHTPMEEEYICTTYWTAGRVPGHVPLQY